MGHFGPPILKKSEALRPTGVGHVLNCCRWSSHPILTWNPCLLCVCTLVNVHVDLLVFTRVAGIQHAHVDLCKHLGIDSSTDLDDRYLKLFLNAYINRHAHTEYLKMI